MCAKCIERIQNRTWDGTKLFPEYLPAKLTYVINKSGFNIFLFISFQYYIFAGFW